MKFIVQVKAQSFWKRLIRRRKYDAPACFDVRVDASAAALFFEKLKYTAAGLSPLRYCGLPLAMLLLSIFAGCGLRKVLRESHSQASAEGNAHFADSLRFANLKTEQRYTKQQADSLSREFTLEIWPKGPFRINSSNGFEGTAEKLRIQGHSQALLRSSVIAEAQTSDHTLAAGRKLDMQQQSSSTSRQVLQKHPAWSWALILLGVAVAWYFGFYLLRSHTFSRL